jgi:hypothetical protein
MSFRRKRLAAVAFRRFFYQNFQHIALAVDRPPWLVRLDTDRDDHLAELPFIRRSRPVTPNLCRDLRTEAIDPFPDRLMADDNAPGGEQIGHIPQAHRETIVGPNGIGNDLTRKAEALQSRN